MPYFFTLKGGDSFLNARTHTHTYTHTHTHTHTKDHTPCIDTIIKIVIVYIQKVRWQLHIPDASRKYKGHI